MTSTNTLGRGRRSAGLIRALLLIRALVFAVDTFGQIAAWDVNGQTAAANHPFSASLLDGGLAEANLTLGGGLGASSTANTFGGVSFDQTSLAGAIAAGDYLSIGLTVSPGLELGLTSMSLLFGVSTAVTNFNLALTSDGSGFIESAVLWSHSFSTALPAAQAISLSGYSFLQGLTDAFEFRLYGWRDPAGTTTFRIRDNSGYDVALFGATTAVPEPETFAATAGALALILAHLIRRRGRFQAGSADFNAPPTAAPGGWSGRQDSNLRPPGPKPGALPG